MKSVTEVRTELDRLVSRYSGKEFVGVLVAERGYLLVRAIDEMVRNHWFWPDKPVVNFHAKGPDEVFIEIKDYRPLHYKITLTKDGSDNE